MCEREARSNSPILWRTVQAHQVTADGRPYTDECIALANLKPHPTGVGAWGFSVPAPRAAGQDGARGGAARRLLRPAKQQNADAPAAPVATSSAHVSSSAAAPSSSPPSAPAAAPAAAAIPKAARGAAKAVRAAGKAARAAGKAARAAGKEARWVLLGAALAQRSAPALGERVQGKYQVRHI